MASSQTFTIANGGVAPDLTISSIVSGSATLTKAGTGELTLSNANTFTGGVTLNAGTLNINNSSALGTIAGTFTINGGVIDNTTGALITTVNYPQSWNGDFTFTGTRSLNLGNGVVTPNANRQLTINGNTLTVGGAIGGGAISLTKLGAAGTLTLSGSNGFSGGLIINAGTVQLGNAGALNSGTPNAVTFGAASTGRLQLNGNSVTISGLNTNVAVGTPIVENLAGGAATLTVSTSGSDNYGGANLRAQRGGTHSHILEFSAECAPPPIQYQDPGEEEIDSIEESISASLVSGTRIHAHPIKLRLTKCFSSRCS